MSLFEHIRQGVAGLSDVWRVIRGASALQATERQRLITEFQSIATAYEKAYSATLRVVRSVDDALESESNNAAAVVRGLATNAAMAKHFSRGMLCGQIDRLISDLTSHLSPLKYSLAVSGLEEIQKQLKAIENYDGAVEQSFMKLRASLLDVATRLKSRDDVERGVAMDEAKLLVGAFADSVRVAHGEVSTLLKAARGAAWKGKPKRVTSKQRGGRRSAG